MIAGLKMCSHDDFRALPSLTSKKEAKWELDLEIYTPYWSLGFLRPARLMLPLLIEVLSMAEYVSKGPAEPSQSF